MGQESRPKNWMWRRAIREASASALPPLTRLVLLTLADFFDYDDVTAKPAWPNVKTLMEQTGGLSNRSIATHLQNAVAAGFLEIARAHRGGTFRNNEYIPRFPSEGGSREGASRERGTEVHVNGTASVHVKQLHADQSKTTNPMTERRKRQKMSASLKGTDKAMQEYCITRHHPARGDWEAHVWALDRDLAKTISGRPFFFVSSEFPAPNASLPTLEPGSNSPPSANSSPRRPKKGARQ